MDAEDPYNGLAVIIDSIDSAGKLENELLISGISDTSSSESVRTQRVIVDFSVQPD